MSDRWAQSEQIFQAMTQTLDAHVPSSPGWTMAELGVGRWGFGRFYARRFRKVYGIDVEDYSEHHPGVEFVISDGKTIPLPDQTVHLTVSHSVLEHVADLDATLSEINRITKGAGYVYLTVSPLYYSGFGAHLYRDGKRLENWEHLDPRSGHFMCRNPIPDAATTGHALNMLTSSMFLAAVGRVPWRIIRYELIFESKEPPAGIVRPKPELDLLVKGFRFVGQRAR